MAARTEITGQLVRRTGCVVLAIICLVAALGLGGAPVSASALLPSGFAETTVAILGANSLPTAMAFAPDGRLFVCQKYGQLRIIKDGALLATPFLTVSTNGSNERGLLGVAFDPDFATNNYVYIFYTVNSAPIHNRVSRFTASGDIAIPGSEVVITEFEPVTTSYHNAGAINFGTDGKLYIAVGNDNVNENSQSLTNRLGKILRINKDGSIPIDNPFYNTATGDNRAIWAYGLRNPFKFAIQPGTSRLFINDVGYEAWEEINDGIAGSNYGWPACEGMCSPPNPDFRDPLFVYGHGNGDTLGRAITGGAFYNPDTPTFPGSYVGKYFFADYVNGWIHYLDPATKAVSSFAAGIPNLVDLAVGPDGALYYLTIQDSLYSDYRGAIRKIQYTGIASPQIGQQPFSQTSPAGTAATFEVRASGDSPLAYQWQRNGLDIPGATSSVYTTPAVTAADDGAQFRCVVTNTLGSAASQSATLTVTPNNPPTGTISEPPDGTTYAAGDTITYSGTGIDPEDGTLPPSAFTWQVDFHHDTHVHPGFVPAYSGATGGSFTIPTTGETSANVWYRISLTVKDSAGATQTSYRDVKPRTSMISLATNPPGLQVTLDGQPQTGPSSVLGVVGMTRTLGVVSPQTVNGVSYEFDSWSDGGAATHDIATAASDTTYTANYRVCSSCAPPLAASYSSSPPTSWSAGQTQTYSVTVTNTGSQTWNAGGAQIVRLGVHFGTASDYPGDGWATDQRFYLPGDVAPGASVTLKVTVTAPANGTYVLRHRMVKENVAWFDQIQKTGVVVAAAPPTDTTAPTVTSTTPADGSTGVAGTSTVTATFSEAMDATTLTTATVTLMKQGATAAVPAALTYDAPSLTVTLRPSAALDASATYVATVKGGTSGVKDQAGNALAADKGWTFTTAAPADTTPPTVVSVTPADGATGTVTTTAVAATFSEAMDPATLTTTTVTLVKQGASTTIAAAVSYDAGSRTVTLRPAAYLQTSTAYTATIRGGGTGAKDTAGNALAADKVWGFTTTATPADAAVFVSQSVPTSMAAGQGYTVSVTMRNSGTSTWTAGDKHALGFWNPRDAAIWGSNRAFLSAPVAPGTDVTFTFTVTAPATPGTYNFQWRMVQDGVMWFGDATTNVAVQVR